MNPSFLRAGKSACATKSSPRIRLHRPFEVQGKPVLSAGHEVTSAADCVPEDEHAATEAALVGRFGSVLGDHRARVQEVERG